MTLGWLLLVNLDLLLFVMSRLLNIGNGKGLLLMTLKPLLFITLGLLDSGDSERPHSLS